LIKTHEVGNPPKKTRRKGGGPEIFWCGFVKKNFKTSSFSKLQVFQNFKFLRAKKRRRMLQFEGAANPRKMCDHVFHRKKVRVGIRTIFSLQCQPNPKRYRKDESEVPKEVPEDSCSARLSRSAMGWLSLVGSLKI